MMKITALNEELDEENESCEEVTREALEQIALQEYAKALELQRKGNLKDAAKLLNDLLDTELLYSIVKPDQGEKAKEPLFNLKYLCFKNLANILSSLGEIQGAVEAYFSAAALDDTDVNLWYRLGVLCFTTNRYDTALQAFQRGYDCNPKHWPTIDKIITLLLGLGYYNDCIVAIDNAFELDPSYLRGLIYKQHIFTSYPYIKDYLTNINPKFALSSTENYIGHPKADTLLKEAENIRCNIEQQMREDTFKSFIPELKLVKSISKYTWTALGESLVHMHHYMSEKSYSHASIIELVAIPINTESKLDVGEESKKNETSINNNIDLDQDKPMDIMSETEINEMSDKNTDTEKVESDADNPQYSGETNKLENKEQKRTPARRRGSALSFLEQWQWCTKRRSGRKKKSDKTEETIHDILKRLMPLSLCPKKSDNRESGVNFEESPDTMDLFNLFQAKDQTTKSTREEYFGTSKEENDVNEFIQYYNINKSDIITILRDYLTTLAKKWNIEWTENLLKIYPDAVICFNDHFDIPSHTSGDPEDIQTYVLVNLVFEEIVLNEKLNSNTGLNNFHSLDTLESIGVMTRNPLKLGDFCMTSKFRYLWAKCHCHTYNKNDDLALDCLYELLEQFVFLGEAQNDFHLNIQNFPFKPILSKNEVESYIKFLDRNKRLDTVMALYDSGNYEEVLEIVIDSFEHCKYLARKLEYNEMSLHFAVQMSLILDSYWALGKVNDCLKWSVICLHEALKHYFLTKSATLDQEKWSMIVVKVLSCMEHILKLDGMNTLDVITPKSLSQCIQNLIQIAGHQIEDSGNVMPFDSVSHWIILHYILQREEDQGRGKIFIDGEKVEGDDIPSSIMVLFIAHDHLGEKSWCCNCKGQLLYFILDTVIPRLQAPALAKPLECIRQHLEQVVFCLFGHPSKKTRLKYLTDHNVTPHSLTWERAQQVYCLYKLPDLPEIEGTYTISVDNEQFFQRILALLPPESDPKKHVADVIRYAEGKIDKLPSAKALLPYKMKDIYFLIGDFYFKKDERSKSIKYNLYDIVMNSERFESWAEIALAKSTNLSMKLNSGTYLKSDMEYLNEATIAIRYYKRALEIDSSHSTLWMEFGTFTYCLHSFCSRVLKQASESLSMEDFESLEKQKEDLLDTSQNCFLKASEELNITDISDRSSDELWLHLYMLGKIAEKRKKPPSKYLGYYLEAASSLYQNAATYPSKISYNSPQQLSIEALEVQYRIHASILKYIEQHENKEVPYPEGKVFLDCLRTCSDGPFSKKKQIKESIVANSTEDSTQMPKTEMTPPQASPILKRSISDAGDEGPESKNSKLELAAKIRRTVSYEADQSITKEFSPQIEQKNDVDPAEIEENQMVENKTKDDVEMLDVGETDAITSAETLINVKSKKIEETASVKISQDCDVSEQPDKELNKNTDEELKPIETESSSKGETSCSSSSDSSSDCDSSSSSSSDSSNESDERVLEDPPSLSEEDKVLIISACLDALEDCVSRFPVHYKALYRLAHYHFYYKKGKDIERCRDLMLGTFISRSKQKLQGLFSERKNNNFFNGVWRIPNTEIDRYGSFASHMSRCVLLSMEILKEIDDHKTLLDLSLHLQRTPEQDKKYLKESEREELAQQACSLCVQSLKGQLIKFSQQSDLKFNEIEKKTLNMLMLDIYRAYQRVQKTPNAKQFTNLLIEGFKLASTTPVNESSNLVDASMKYCQSLIANLKQQAAIASQEKSANQLAKKQSVKSSETVKAVLNSDTKNPPMNNTPKISTSNQLSSNQLSESNISPPKTPQEIAASFESYLSQLNDSLISQQTAAALTLSYMSKLSQLAGFNTLPNALEQTMQNAYQNTFQTEFYRQFLTSNLNKTYTAQQPKHKPTKRSKSFNIPSVSSTFNTQQTPSTSKFTGNTNFSVKSISKPYPTSKPSIVSNYIKSQINNKNGNSSSKPLSSSIPKLSKHGQSGWVNQSLSKTLVNSSAASSLPMPISSSNFLTVSSNLSKSVSAPSTSTTDKITGLSSFASGFTPYSSSLSSNVPCSSYTSTVQPAHMNTTSTVNAAINTKPPQPHQQTSPGKTLQEKLAERQKNIPAARSLSNELASSISKLPSSLTVTKTNKSGSSLKDFRRPETKKPSTGENLAKPKNPNLASEVIILDDDSL